MHVMACAVALTAFAGSDWREAETDSLLGVEHLVSVLLEREEQGSLTTPSPSQDILTTTIAALECSARAVSATTSMQMREVDGTDDALKKLTHQFTLHEALIRGPGHETDEKIVLRRLFGTEEQARLTARIVGLTIDDMLAFEEGFTTIAERRHRLLEIDDPSGLLRPSIVKKLTVTPDVLSRETGRDLDTTRRFLDLISCEFGQKVEGGAVVWGNNVVRAKPVVRTVDGRYLCTVPLDLLWTLRPTLERELKRSNEWHTYEVHRASTIQSMAADALRYAVHADDTWQNVAYRFDGDSKMYEADIILRVDRTALVVEVKAGDFSAGALKGRARDVGRVLHELVGKASEQAQRLGTTAATAKRAMFFDRPTGKPVHVDLDGVERVEALVITLRDLAWLQQDRSLLTTSGIVTDARRPPWIGSLYDLLAISDLVEHPAELTLFFRARRAVPTNVTSIGDELNMYMLHLDSSLKALQGKGPLVLMKHTEPLDAYRMFGGPKPTMRLSQEARRIMERELAERAPGWLRRCERVIEKQQRRRRPRFASQDEMTRSALERLPSL